MTEEGEGAGEEIIGNTWIPPRLDGAGGLLGNGGRGGRAFSS